MNPDFEARELFMLLLLREISQRLSGRPFAVKGGVALRFFYQSPRLSEDMDLDVAGVSPPALKNAVEKVLVLQSFNAVLEGKGVEVFKWSVAKQTSTTQRWKIQLSVTGRVLNTKLEFSRRRAKIEYVSGLPDGALLSHYQVMTYATQYYSIEEMIKQKIFALASPTRTAARDLFDMHFLIDKKRETHINMPPKIINAAYEKCRVIDFNLFKNQAIPFLPDDLAAFFTAINNYKNMQEQIMDRLKGLMTE